MEQPTTYVRINVAKDGVDIAVRPTGHSWHTPYDEAEVALLVAKLQDLKPARNLAGNPDSPQAVIFLTSMTDVMMGS